MRFRDVPNHDLRVSKQSRSSYDADRGDQIRATEGAEHHEDSWHESEELNDRHSDELNVYESQLRRQASHKEEGISMQVE
jgi:hypothetical protein